MCWTPGTRAAVSGCVLVSTPTLAPTWQTAAPCPATQGIDRRSTGIEITSLWVFSLHNKPKVMSDSVEMQEVKKYQHTSVLL